MLLTLAIFFYMMLSFSKALKATRSGANVCISTATRIATGAGSHYFHRLNPALSSLSKHRVSGTCLFSTRASGARDGEKEKAMNPRLGIASNSGSSGSVDGVGNSGENVPKRERGANGKKKKIVMRTEKDDAPDRPFTLPPGAFKPKQSLGQNFLSDQNYVMKIVNAFENDSEKGKRVIEVGPGPGALSRVRAYID